MRPKQLPPQNTIALTTTGMERERKRERLRHGERSDAEQEADERYENEMEGGLLIRDREEQ